VIVLTVSPVESCIMKLHCPSNVILAGLFVFISLSGCASIGKNNGMVQKNVADSELIILPTTHDQQAELYKNILIGRIAAGRQLYEQALRYYMAALEIRADIELAREALVLSEQLNQRQKSVRIARLWVKQRPDALIPWKLITFYSIAEQQSEETRIGMQKVLSLETNLADLLTFFGRLSNGRNQALALELLQSFMGTEYQNPAIPLAIARIYQQRNEWSKAIALTSEVIAAEPEMIMAWKFHGSLLLASGAKSDAINWYKKTINKFPDSDDVRHTLGQLLYDVDRFAEARQQFEKILALSPGDKDSSYMIAACYYSENNYSKSREYFEPLLRVRRHRNPVLFYLGEMARRDTKLAQAISLYRQITPSRYYQTAHILVAQLMQQQEQHQQALDYLKNLKPGDESSVVEFKLTSLRLMVSQGEHQQVEQYLAEVLQQHPEFLNVQLYRMQWLIEKGDARDIPQLVPQILTHFPTRAERKEFILSVATLLQGNGISALAITVLNVQLTDSEDIDLRYMRAMIAANMGDILMAEKDLRLILNSEPEHVDALNALGYTLADANKNLPEAFQMIQRAYNTNPDSSAIVDSMGWVLYRLGNFTEALIYLQQAYDLEPSDEIASHLGEILWSMDKKERAKKIFASAINKSPNSDAIKKTMEKFNIVLDKGITEK